MELCDLLQRRAAAGRRTSTQKTRGFEFFDWLAIKFDILNHELNPLSMPCTCENCASREREASAAFETAFKEVSEDLFAAWDFDTFRKIADAMELLEKERSEPEPPRVSRINKVVMKAFSSLFFKSSRLPTVSEWRDETRRMLDKNPEESITLDDKEWARAKVHFSMDCLHPGYDYQGAGTQDAR